MRLILIFSLALCASCVSNLDAEAHRLALWNFRYEEDKYNEFRIYNSISNPFAGDCEDFAFTLRRQIGGDVWLIKLEDMSYHAALLKNNIVYDNMYRRAVKLDRYHGKFIRIMNEEEGKAYE
jgi:hypothetical protein